MRIQLSDRFGYGRMLRFVAPSVVMMIFTSIYNVVDGFFVSNFVGKVPFAAINLMMPLFIFMMALGFMLGTGGSAIVAQTLGEGKKELANRYFSLLIYATLAAGTFITVLGLLGLERIAVWLGARGEMLDNCILYGRVILPSMPLFLVQSAFQSFFVTAEKPKLGLAFTVAAGVANIVLDALFVMVFRWGLAGAAILTYLNPFDNALSEHTLISASLKRKLSFKSLFLIRIDEVKIGEMFEQGFFANLQPLHQRLELFCPPRKIVFFVDILFYRLSGHQQHASKSVGTFFDELRRPISARNANFLPILPVAEQMTKLVGERIALACRFVIISAGKVDEDKGGYPLPCKRYSPEIFIL